MSDLSNVKCSCCGEPIERVRYFPRQLLTADDMRIEQEYVREKLRRHNRYLHGWGVVCGCTVEPVPNAKGLQVRVCPGYAVGPQGDEIWISECIDVDLKTGPQDQPCSVRWPCPPVGEMPGERDRSINAYIAVRYAECYSRPVRVHPAGCGCDEVGCEYSRIRDSFEIKVLWELPQSHIDAQKDDEVWCATVHKLPPEGRRLHTFPVPPCPECVTDPWVVLATVNIPGGAVSTHDAPVQLHISYVHRRVLLATQRLQTAMLCLP
ncbi:MAG: hypothetical protein ACJ8NR_11110 [Sulfurifustis sp.]